MAETAHLGLTYLEENQARRHITINGNLDILDTKIGAVKAANNGRLLGVAGGNAAAVEFGGGLGLVDGGTRLAVVDNAGEKIAEGKILFGGASGSLRVATGLHYDRVNGRLGIGTSAPMTHLVVGGAAGLEVTGGSSQAWLQVYNRALGEYKPLQIDASLLSVTRAGGAVSVAVDSTSGFAAYNPAGTKYLSVNTSVYSSLPLVVDSAYMELRDASAGASSYTSVADGHAGLHFLRHYVSATPLPRWAVGLDGDGSYVVLAYDNSGSYAFNMMKWERLTGRCYFGRFINLASATPASPLEGDLWRSGDDLRMVSDGESAYIPTAKRSGDNLIVKFGGQEVSIPGTWT